MFTALHLFFDDVELDQEWESPGRTITQTDVVNFAGLSGDFNPIHMDHEFAKSTPYRRPIAHGVLGMSICSGLGVSSPLMRTIAFLGIREWNFRLPIFIGDTVHVKAKLIGKEPRSRGRRAVLTWQRQLINQEGRVVQEGILSALVEGRGLMVKERELEPEPVGVMGVKGD